LVDKARFKGKTSQTFSQEIVAVEFLLLDRSARSGSPTEPVLLRAATSKTVPFSQTIQDI